MYCYYVGIQINVRELLRIVAAKTLAGHHWHCLVFQALTLKNQHGKGLKRLTMSPQPICMRNTVSQFVIYIKQYLRREKLLKSHCYLLFLWVKGKTKISRKSYLYKNYLGGDCIFWQFRVSQLEVLRIHTLCQYDFATAEVMDDGAWCNHCFYVTQHRTKWNM